MRIATWNVEWFNSLFDREGEVKDGDAPSGRYGVGAGERVEAVTRVLRALDADALMVIEAPAVSRRRDGGALLEAFAERAGIRARRALIGFANDTRQEIALLHDPGALTARHDPREGPDAPRFDRQVRLDPDGEGIMRARFSKPPLEAACRGPGGPFGLIGAHTKAKGARGDDPAERARTALASRRKQMAQCVWLRRRAEAHLAAGERLIVLGDLNDGPGLDAYEAMLGRSGVEVIMGPEGPTRLHDPHALASIEAGPGAGPTTARFQMPGEAGGEPVWMEALLDYAMVSPAVMALGPRWRVWHPLRPPCSDDPDLARALTLASDHFPVSVDVDL